MKKAFMRGVCALNMEAMSMFKEGQPCDEYAEGHAFEPPTNNNHYPCTVGAASTENNDGRYAMTSSLETMQTHHGMYISNSKTFCVVFFSKIQIEEIKFLNNVSSMRLQLCEFCIKNLPIKTR